MGAPTADASASTSTPLATQVITDGAIDESHIDVHEENDKDTVDNGGQSVGDSPFG